jgi:predicted transcriptional regulator
MRDIQTQDEIITLCKALSSPMRLEMLKLIGERKRINLNDVAEALKITNGAVTQHMKPLLDADLVECTFASGKRGSQKICTLKEHKFLLDLLSRANPDLVYQTEIPVGSYTDYSIFPTCGIATCKTVIGEVDEPKYFDAPERAQAGILWFTKGFVEYRIPNYLKKNQTLGELQISMEICSEAPGVCANWPSDIHFSLNDAELGFWTSPGDFGGEVRGIFTPEWWNPVWNSFGLLKLLSINREGTYIDGGKISDVNISNLMIQPDTAVKFRISVPETAKNLGGATIFGKGFGNYNQDIRVRMIFSEEAN